MPKRKIRKNVDVFEAWLDGSYYATFADGDIGDQNHEAVAFESALGLDNDLVEKLYREHDIEINANGVPEEELGELYAEENDIEVTEETDLHALGRKWLEEHGADLEFLDWGGDARSYMMHKANWVRAAGSNFQVHELNAEALANIRDTDLWENVETDDELEPDQSEDEVWLEEMSTGETYALTLKDLLNDAIGPEGIKRIARGEEWAAPEVKPTPVFRKDTTDKAGVDSWIYKRVGENPRRRKA